SLVEFGRGIVVDAYRDGLAGAAGWERECAARRGIVRTGRSAVGGRKVDGDGLNAGGRKADGKDGIGRHAIALHHGDIVDGNGGTIVVDDRRCAGGGGDGGVQRTREGDRKILIHFIEGIAGNRDVDGLGGLAGVEGHDAVGRGVI